MQFMNELKNIAIEAGNEIMLIDQRGYDIFTKDDGSRYTDADIAAHNSIKKGLTRIDPSIPIVSEEDGEEKCMQALLDGIAKGSYWLVDPLDGTNSFINGNDGFGVHIALIECNESNLFLPTKSVVFFPKMNNGTLYFTGEKRGAYKEILGQEAKEIKVQDFYGDTEIKASVSFIESKRPLDIFGNQYKSVPAVGGGRICQVAEGNANITIIEEPFSYWDIAAGYGILIAAGGEAYDVNTGQTLCLNGAPAKYNDNGQIKESSLVVPKCCFASNPTFNYLRAFDKWEQKSNLRPAGFGI